MVQRGIAQLVEHRSPKPGVVGSSPATPANKNGSATVGPFLLHLSQVWVLRQGFSKGKYHSRKCVHDERAQKLASSTRGNGLKDGPATPAKNNRIYYSRLDYFE
jgi:hypothetical protein